MVRGVEVMQVIGIRKMLVIMFCVAGICFIAYNRPKLDQMDCFVCGLIAGLGGYHSWRQGIIDKEKAVGNQP